MKCKTFPWFLLRTLSLVLLAQVSHGNKTYYMDEYASYLEKEITLRDTSYADSSIVILGTRKSFPTTGEFQLTIVPPNVAGRHVGLVGTVQEFNIGKSGSKCSDIVQIYAPNWLDNIDKLIFKGCENMPLTFKSESPFQDRLVINLNIGATLTYFFKFQITVTTYNLCMVEQFKNKEEFYCTNGKCINEKLKCNHRDNCGDNSDESDETCSNNSKLSPLLTGITIAGSVLFVIAVTAGFYCYCKSRKPSVTTITTFQNQPTVTYPATSYPAQPNAGYIYPSTQPAFQPPQPWTNPYPANQPEVPVNSEYSAPQPPYYNQTVANNNVNR